MAVPAGEGPYFFFSYAHTPRHNERDTEDPDVWVGKLFDKICGHIMHLTDLPQGMAGFMDRDLRPGQQWPRRLSEALATCKVFVPLYSSRYFSSDDCGKEWFAFSRRMLNHAARVSEVDAIVPALWAPMPNLPTIAQEIQFEHRALNETYGARGFYQIMKIKRYADDYEEATLGLAHRIIELAQDKERGLSVSVPAEYGKLESAFDDEHWNAPGNQRVRFIIAAPSKNELTADRSTMYYGSTLASWNPYGPESRFPLAAHAAGLARALSYRADIGDIEEDAEELLSEGPASGPQVLLVDPWVMRHQPYQQLLERFDKLNKPWVQVVVVCNENDRELAAARNELMPLVNSTLRNKLQAGRVVSRPAAHGIQTLEDFSSCLPPVIHAAARQYLKSAGMRPPGS